MSLIPSSFWGTRPRTNIFDPFSSTDLWDPFYDLSFTTTPSLSTFGGGPTAETAQLANTRIDWRETPEAHIFKADLPGVRKEEVKVEVEDGDVLRISGQRSREQEEKGDTWHRLERSSGSFVRRFRLPDNAKMEQIKASMENGVLTVTVPKAAAAAPGVKAIDIA